MRLKLFIYILVIYTFYFGADCSIITNEFACQCYCTVSDYDVSNGNLDLLNFSYYADVKAINLPESSIDSILQITANNPIVRTDEGLLKEYRFGTVGIWNSAIDLKKFDSIDAPFLQDNIFNVLGMFDSVFMTVNNLDSNTVDNANTPQIIFIRDYIDTNNNVDFDLVKHKRDRMCKNICNKPNTDIKNYSFSRIEFIELSNGGVISEQMPSSQPNLYNNLVQSISSNKDSGKCIDILNQFIESNYQTTWFEVFKEFRKIEARNQANIEFSQLNPMLSRSVDDPLLIKMSNNYSEMIKNSIKARNFYYQQSILEKGIRPLKGFPENVPDFLNLQVSSLFQFRAVLKVSGSKWRVKELYKGRQGGFGYESEFLHLMITNEEINHIVRKKTELIESWVNSYWNVESVRKRHNPKNLPKLETVKNRDIKNKMELWLEEKEDQVRKGEFDTFISFLQQNLRSIPSVSLSGDFIFIQPKDEKQTKEEVVKITGIEEIHIIYYGLLTLNCFSSVELNYDSHIFSSNKQLVFNTFIDKIYMREDLITIKEIVIPDELKKWHILPFDMIQNGFIKILKAATQKFSDNLYQINRPLYFVIFRDLKHLFNLEKLDVFNRNVCSLPTRQNHIRVIYENSETLTSSPIKLFDSNLLQHLFTTYINFNDYNHFNYLLEVLTKCFHAVPPSSRVRIVSHDNGEFIPSEHICALDYQEHHHAFQRYA